MPASARPSASVVRRANLIEEALVATCLKVNDVGELAREAAVCATAPNRVADLLWRHLHVPPSNVIVTGALDQRLLFLKGLDGWILLSLSARPLAEVAWPAQLTIELNISNPAHYLSRVELTENGVHRLTRPRVELVALYHPEVFPLPRFPLGISDLARSLRHGLLGQVRLDDMQLTPDLGEIVQTILEYCPDILGVSATFGQYDVMTELLDRVDGLSPKPSLVVLGGSLSALNQQVLLARFPRSVVAHGPGELPLRDLAAFWHGDIDLGQVRGITYRGEQTIAITRRIDNRTYDGILPELDLLHPTLEHHGVMQLESSRGCTHACSFCPRKHKGVWSGDDPASIESILPDLVEIYAGHPNIARKIYLVDEEFIGYDQGGEETARVDGVASCLHRAGFRWETSARVDQVYRPDRDRDWHVRRMQLWKRLRSQGLDRCLFGVESGVDSILRRFNKHTTAQQNVMAIRMLSACDIPIRCTYITFDQLMSFEELLASYEFQGRTDLLLTPIPNMRLEELWTALHDDDFVRQHQSGRPFYVSISYMLVSMECLLKSPYLKLVEAEGLAEEVLPSMGRRNARFREPVIGLLSQWSQRWIDRNFSFDYTLKSLEKITDLEEKAGIRRLRVLLKRSSYRLLGRMLALGQSELASESIDAVLGRELEAHFTQLQRAIERERVGVDRILPDDRRAILHDEHENWSTRRSWDFINSPDQCV